MMKFEVGSDLKFTKDFNEWFSERHLCSPETYYGGSTITVNEVVELDGMKEIYFRAESGELECIFLNGSDKFCIFSSRGGMGESPCEVFESTEGS